MNDYQATLDWIYSLANWETRTSAGGVMPEWNLARMARLLGAVGNPHYRYPTVHVAGTKGKGSTSAMISAVLHTAGYRTGLYTSPHLHTFRERIRVAGRLISETELGDLVEKFRPIVAEIPGLTTFEVVTAMAFAYFASQEVDVAVIEVGLGGRLDATNVVTPLVSVITSLSLDHMALLGHSLPEIAGEKAGIIKPGIPVVSSSQPAEALAVIERVAVEREAPLILVGRDWTWQPGEISVEGQAVEITKRCDGETARRGDGETRRDGDAERQIKSFAMSPRPPFSASLVLWVPLLGRHQLVNATTAVAALDVLRARGLNMSESALRAGIASTFWPGRLEVLSRQPLLVVDGAHNADSARRLVEALDDWFGRRRRLLIFGASFDKDIEGMLDALVPGSDRVLLVRSRHPRHSELDDLAARVAQRGGEVVVCPNVDGAIQAALALAGHDDLICVTGSLFVVAEAREAWFALGHGAQPESDPPPPVSARAAV